VAKYAILKSFYASEAWIKFRLYIIGERGPKCVKCKSVIANPKDIILHHKKELTPENVHDVSISLNPVNIEVVCFDCHNKIHNRFGYQSARSVYIVYGAPLSGKKTYVKDNMKRGDIVIDMDMLYQALSLQDTYSKPDNLFSNVMAVHNQLIDHIKTRYGKWHNAWIIGGYADKYKREKTADDIGAEIIFCDVSKIECINRLAMDDSRQCMKEEWTKYINKWFDDYVA
jgi:hypothetical protein